MIASPHSAPTAGVTGRGVLAGLWMLAFACACREPVVSPPPPAPTPVRVEAPSEPDWASTSSDGKSELKQTASADGKCQVACSSAGSLAWSTPGCLAARHDFAFVSNGCSQAVLLFEFPEGSLQADAVVGLVLGPNREPGPLSLGSFLADLSKVRVNGKHLGWLGGVLGQRGAKPHARPDGTGVEWETVDGKIHNHSFEELAQLKPVAEVKPGEGDNRLGLYQWTNSEGSTQVSSYASIPLPFRKKAKAVVARIDAKRSEAQAALRELERQAANAAVPFEWRR